MVKDTQSADFEETDNPYHDISKGACCLGTLSINANVKLTFPNPNVDLINFEARLKRTTKTECIGWSCGDILVGEDAPHLDGPILVNVCEAAAERYNQEYNGGGKIIATFTDRTLDPLGIRRPVPPNGPFDAKARLRFKHHVSLGCCDYGCAPRFWNYDGGDSVLNGSVPGRPVKVRRLGPDGYSVDAKGRPYYIFEEGVGFSKDTWNKVFDAILAKFGPGGQYPYKFKPCCKKGDSGGDSGGGNSGGSSGG